MHHLVYLHGFLSSPASLKAQQTLAYTKRHYPAVNVHVPQLPGDISKALHIIDSLVSTLPKQSTRFIGSSMGGYLATYCVEKYGGKAVLVNPAVEPFYLLSEFIGSHINPYTNEKFYIHNEHIKILKNINVTHLKQAQSYKVLLQTQDETLDYRLAANKYANACLTIEQGGDHSFVGYDKHLPGILAFLK